MKFIAYLLLILTNSLCFIKASAQVKNYEAQWKKVDELIGVKNLPISALTEVKTIYAQAKKDRQDAQIIKALVYMVGLQRDNRENNQVLAIKDIEKEIPLHKGPAVLILKSLLANLYWHYFQNHRWQLYERSNTVNFVKDDIATWTPEDFHKKISNLYLQSIENEKLLQQVTLQLYDAIIIKGNARRLRPTLYDLLAHQALDYFKSNERDLKKPAYAFELVEEAAYAPASQFATFHFETKDSLSLQHKAIEVYQRLLAFHLAGKNTAALVDVDIERLQFVHQNSVHPDKDSLYVQALETMIKQYAGNKTSNQAVFLLASFYNQSAETYKPFGDTAHRYDKLKAISLLEAVVKDSIEKNEGWTNSYNLLHQIQHPSFAFEIEKVNVPGQPFRALVKFKNITALHFRLIHSAEDLKASLERRNSTEQYWSNLLKEKPLKEWTQLLPVSNDFQDHSVEIKIDGLPVGDYFLLASSQKEFEKRNTQLGAQLFHVSNISYITKGENYFVLHRQSGQPLENAQVTVYKQEYDYKTSRYRKAKIGAYKADKNGWFLVETKEDERRYNYMLDIKYAADRLSMDDQQYGYYYYDEGEKDDEEDESKKIFFYTDRSLYRPGQTVYFKGIGIVKNKNKKLATNYTTTIFLEDANRENIDSIRVTTNEYGSFSGKFVLPQNSLNGRFRIYDEEDENELHFSVEDYKRPKFYVDFEKVKSTYKVTDTVTITGLANAYAGNVIDKAKVVYRVVRQPRFMYPWLFRSWFPPTAAMEIAHGETTTGDNGKFSISFVAIPDKKIKKEMDPVFDYRIYADITDINGETRSGEMIVSAGYKSLVLQTNLPERIETDSLKHLFITTENMNGVFQSSLVTVNFTKLVPENRLIRKRYWQQPDMFVLSKEEFISYFPHDEYNNETDFKTWKKGEVQFSKTDSSRADSKFVISNSNLKQGYYEVAIVTRDGEGREIKDIQYLELFDATSNNFTKPEYLWAKASGKPIEPGETTRVQIGSSATNIFVINETDKRTLTEKRKEGSSFEFERLSNEKKTWQFTATENDRGGYGLNFFFVKDNRFYQFNDVIEVPWTNKELKIEYTTFRDKTLPGSDEKWSVTITGYKNEKIAAEMLASMYDASLDQFKPHEWYKPGIWPVYARPFVWNGNQNFTDIESVERWISPAHRDYSKQYDKLIFNQYQPVAVTLRGLAGRAPGVKVREEAADLSEVVVTGYGLNKVEMSKFTPPVIKQEEIADTIIKTQNQQEVTIRNNFNETAFFFPHLHTDENGAIEFSFTAPEALTRWKLQTLAHTKELAFGLNHKELITQKELMVQTNAPRFLRQGDKLEFSTKIVNLSDKEFTGQVQLQLVDAVTNQSVDGWFLNSFPNQYFTVAAGGSEVVKFPIQVPHQFSNALVWRVIARADNFSDGEENMLPVLSNRLLVTETLPLPMRGSSTKTFNFQKLASSGESETLQHHALTVEYTSNPAWLVVQALPYLMDFPYECAEQTWNRYYANAIASHMVQTTPRIKQIFERWRETDSAALLSNLQKNEELKSALLEETPWVLAAKTEEEQKKNIAVLFDMVRMSNELKSNLEKLKQMQSSNGGFVWFKGGPDDRYITQYIVTGIGHLQKLGIPTPGLESILSTAIPYLDKKLKEDYDQLLKSKADRTKQQISYLQAQFLYMRSFFKNKKLPSTTITAYNYYRKQAQTFWMQQNNYVQGMLALFLHRTGDSKTPVAIIRSLKERALVSEEMGMYWKDMQFGYSWFWWHAPIETQSLLIETFFEISKDKKSTDDLRTWLLKNKQTNNWRTTKATAEACYALLLQGTDWLSAQPTVQINLGTTSISNQSEKTEAGTGYFKKTIDAKTISPAMADIRVTVQQAVDPATHQTISSPSWGAVYWQYFEDMDKITTAATPLQINKKLFKETGSDRGPVLSPVDEGTELKVGDKIKVRIELRVDRDMEYVHMKDLRASALEPVNVLSGYKWQGGLGYYESTRDASTHFFFNYLRKGTYVFEYPLFVTHTGTFSNGITTIQCMYAPEFSAHSEGIRITVE